MRAVKIKDEVLRVLDAAIIAGSNVTLSGQLDRKLYQDVNKVLEAAGGKWNRSAKAHVFEGLAVDTLEPIILTGEYSRTKQDFGQFDTPPSLALDVVARADIQPGMKVLEPSAGIGNLAAAAIAAGGLVTTWEIDPGRADMLRKVAGAVNVGDFLARSPMPMFDRVVMNPPFAKQDDIRHVLHAAKFLKPGGRLVSVMSASITFRDNRLTTDFREFVAAHNGRIERLPDGSFEASGTSVNTCLVTITPSPSSISV